MTSPEPLLRPVPQTPSAAGDGTTLLLAGGVSKPLAFTARVIMRVESAFGSHETFTDELDRTPLRTLGWLLLNACDVPDEDAAMTLLDGVNWRPLIPAVTTAWKRANWYTDDEPVGPTSGT